MPSCRRFDEIRLAPAPVSEPFPRNVYLIWSIFPGAIYEVEASCDLRQWRKVAKPFYLGGKRNGRHTLLVEIAAESSMSFYRVAVKGNSLD